jgi:hypothetical protein
VVPVVSVVRKGTVALATMEYHGKRASVAWRYSSYMVLASTYTRTLYLVHEQYVCVYLYVS